MDNPLFEGVYIKNLVTHEDERGFFREILRVTDPFFDLSFGQWSHSRMKTGVIKAWHYHKIQTDFWYVSRGILKVGLYDLRQESSTFRQTMSLEMGDETSALLIKIPAMVAHGCKAVHGPVDLLYLMTHTYNPDDEYRMAQDDPEINFKW